jgi:hypothetical protein
MLLALAPRRSVLTLLVLFVGVAATPGILAGVRLERADRLRPAALVLIFRVGHGERFFIGIRAVLVGLDGVIMRLGRMLVGDVMIASLVMTGCVVMLLGRLGVLLGRFEVVLGRRMLVTGHLESPGSGAKNAHRVAALAGRNLFTFRAKAGEEIYNKVALV